MQKCAKCGMPLPSPDDICVACGFDPQEAEEGAIPETVGAEEQ